MQTQCRQLTVILTVLGLVLLTGTTSHGGQGESLCVDAAPPVPAITDGGQNNVVTITLDDGDYGGSVADWWLLAEAMGTWYSWYSDGSPMGAWTPGIIVSHIGPLGDVATPFPVLDTTQLAPGIPVSIYFGVDLTPDGIVTLDLLAYDMVTVAN